MLELGSPFLHKISRSTP